MPKTFRRKTFRRKTFRKKKNINRTTKNRKMRGGYEVKDHGTWKQVIYTDEEKKNIQTYLDNNSANRTVESTEILANLFPGMPDEIKGNAAHEIQVVLGRAYSGNN